MRPSTPRALRNTAPNLRGAGVATAPPSGVEVPCNLHAMVSPRLEPAIEKGRAGLVRRAMARAGGELSRAARVAAVVSEARAGASRAQGPEGSIYGDAYFGVGRDPSGDRQGRSGYATYDRTSSNADIAAYLLWRNFAARRTLDVGCARGYLVEALRELGVDANGSDVSAYAVEHAAPGALGYVRLG